MVKILMPTTSWTVATNNSLAVGGESSSLTAMQFRFMLVLQKRMAECPDIGPTFEELRQDLGLSSKSGVARLVRACEERGRIARLPNKQRSIQILEPVSLDAVEMDFLIKSFSDKELLAEIQARGLLSVNG